MDTIRLSIVTPNGEIFNDDVKTPNSPSFPGRVTVLPGHSSLISSLTVGVIVIEKTNSTEAVAINWGHVKVDEKSVDVLADGAIALTSGKDSEIAKNIEAAKELVKSVKDSNISVASVEAKINSFA